MLRRQRELAYYNLTAPFNGFVGDIPVHLGDYVSSTTLLTTVDENADLEAYIYVPTDLAANIRMGLPVQIVTSTGEPIETTKIYFVSPTGGQRAPGHSGEGADPSSLDKFRNFAAGEGARDLEHGAHADRAGSGRDAHWWAGVSSISLLQKKRHVARQRAVNLGDTVGNNYAVLAAQAGRQSHCLGHPVPDRRGPVRRWLTELARQRSTQPVSLHL